MEWTLPLSGALPTWGAGLSPVVLRLLPHLHYPPARLRVVGMAGPEDVTVQALDARGYRVERGEVGEASPGSLDLICERGLFSSLTESQRRVYVNEVASALRVGGQLFGVFVLSEGRLSVSEILHTFGPYFDAVRLEISSFASPQPGQVLMEAILVRRA